MDAIAPCHTAMFVCYDCALSAASSIWICPVVFD